MQSLDIKIGGLYLFGSELSEAPPGALSVADNIVVNRPSVAEPRRGFDRLTGAFATDTHRAAKIFFYQDKVLCHYGPSGAPTTFAYNTGSAWSNYSGSYSPPSSTVPMRAIEASQNFFFTTSAGVYKLDSYSGTPMKAGAAKGLDLTASLSSSSPWLTDKWRAAYRIVWGYYDANNNLILGTPSQRESIKNTAGSSQSVSIQATIPSGVTTSWIYQLYRSEQIDNTSASTEPSDEMRLVYQGSPSSGNISAGYVTIADIVDDTLRLGAVIYTAASQEGSANGNEPPPLAKDIAVYKNVTFYGNTVSKQRYFLTLLSVGGTNGVAVNDTLIIGGVTFTAKSTETAASGQFRAYVPIAVNFTVTIAAPGVLTSAGHGLSNGDAVTLTTTGALPTGLTVGTTYYVVSAAANTLQLSTSKGGSSITTTGTQSGVHTITYAGSAAQNIRDTAVSLVRVINQYASSTVYAYYLSSSTDLPGKILLEERSLGGAAFVLTSSRTTCWSPTLPTSGTTQSSTADTYKNGVYYSKTSQPEAVPIGNYLFAGSANKNILRVLPLRDSLFILKEDGVYRLSGESAANFRVDLLDSTAILLAPESAVVLNNQIYALTSQGVVTITETGVSVISRPIEATLLSLQGQDLTVLKNATFGVSYESERKYILGVLSVSGDTAPTQAYVYNTFTNTWTRWPLAKTCGGVNPSNDKLYLGDSASQYVNVERKTFRFSDYADYSFQTTISVVSGKTLTLTQADQISAGDIIYQSSTVFSTVASVDAVAGTVTCTSTATFTATTADVLKAISTKIAWVPFTFSNAGMMKQVREVSLLFKSDFTGTGTLRFTSDKSQGQETETFTGTALGLWGLFPWGSVPWGGSNQRRPYRLLVPRSKQRATQLTVQFEHSTGFAAYQLNGISLIGEEISERIAR